jgi:hypothetical protein
MRATSTTGIVVAMEFPELLLLSSEELSEIVSKMIDLEGERAVWLRLESLDLDGVRVGVIDALDDTNGLVMEEGSEVRELDALC